MRVLIAKLKPGRGGALLTLALGAAVAVALLPDVALAQEEDLEGILDRLTDQIAPLGGLVSVASWVVGALLGFTGLNRFRQHAENPNQFPLMSAVGRLLIGALLIALPTVINIVLGTAGIEADTDSQRDSEDFDLN